ncbi:MAG: hypothetical protein Tsb0020_05120 [Haliangiales bacterium]
MARSGAVRGAGEPALADALVRALKAPQHEDEQRGVSRGFTHGLHSYSARLHPSTARQLVTLVASLARAEAATAGAPDAPSGVSPGAGEGQPAQLALIDPFCGAGTVLVEARRAGLSAIGVDANPLAVLIARAKTWTTTQGQRAQLRDLGQQLSEAAVAEGKAARRAGYEAAPLRSPGRGGDAAARSQRLEGWFAPHVRRELEFLAGAIDDLRADEPMLADVLTVVLSSILYKVSRRASDTDPRRVERRVGRGAAARHFGQRVEALCQGLGALAKVASAPMPQVHGGDARRLAELGLSDGSVQAAVTSPPYAGTYDYAEQHRLRLDFLGLPTSRFRDAELGSRRQFAGDAHERRRARRRYKRALAGAMSELARVLAPGAPAAIVLGDSVAGDRAMWADEVLREAAQEHFDRRAWAWQERPLLGRLERDAFGDESKREWVFLLSRK